GLSYLSAWVRHHLQMLFNPCVWLITLHYYYLFFNNAEDINWVVGCFITVMAINLGLLSNLSLLSYSLFVLFLSCGLLYLVPSLRTSVFLPGLLTIILQANLGLRSRLKIIKGLAASNERFQLLFNSTFEGVLVHEDGVIVDVNEALKSMLGYSQNELVGRSVFDILHPDHRGLASEKMNLEVVPPFEIQGLRKDQSVINVEVRAKQFVYENRIVRLVTVQQIDDRKKAEKEKVRALSMAENVRVRDEFISIASHELRTPITILKLQAEVIDRDLKKEGIGVATPERAREFIALLNRQIDRLTELVETMLDVSRISATGVSLKMESFDLASLIQECAGLHQVPELGSLFKLQIPERFLIQGDPRRLEQVIENVFTNAIKYGNGKFVNVGLFRDGSEVVLTIEDQGFGIEPESIDRIFDRFERAIPARNISGLGLGLYIARQIVSAHGGTISVESQLGVGSKFTIRLPG
ncbi:MAG: HAMP domain-containing histidine kinase, partial [Bdellovibrionales bacterium]|nr:HAMP domain-containing histidine kinase [Bdellovibrionales bacterium]